MMLTPDEYMSLMRLIRSERESEGAMLAAREESPAAKPKRRSRSARANDKKMAMALEKANADLRKKNGDLRKGVSQADIMRRAHRIKKTL